MTRAEAGRIGGSVKSRRNSEDTSGETLTVKVLKYTRGKAGKKIVCNFSGATMKITERARACVYPNAEDA